ncbi:MAG TPA: hypothetical protein VMN82_01300 [Thermoanaerobaculia bacterium]|nr:hypothetical protein [Thermoanaerobaculia bacterium]
MNYYWTVCPACACEVTIQYVETPGGLEGSLRRWSRDRATNDGKKLETPKAQVGANGAFGASCVCGAAIAVDPAAVTRATTERPAL